jgi:hypothetical protein
MELGLCVTLTKYLVTSFRNVFRFLIYSNKEKWSNINTTRRYLYNRYVKSNPTDRVKVGLSVSTVPVQLSYSKQITF